MTLARAHNQDTVPLNFVLKMFACWITQLISAILIHWIAGYWVENVTRLEQLL